MSVLFPLCTFPNHLIKANCLTFFIRRCVKCRYAIKKLLDKQTKLALAGALPEEEAAEKPKKPASAYMLFSKEMRPTVVEENPDMSFGEVGRELGARWRALSDDEKAKYKKKPE